MTTSIWPSAAMASTVASGRTNDHDVLPSASGATIAATTHEAPVASQTGRNRAATSGARDERATGRCPPSRRDRVAAMRRLCSYAEQCQLWPNRCQ